MSKTVLIDLKTGNALERITRIIVNGGIAAVPTETVYGLAADASNGEAVASIFEAKGRPRFNPLICHVSSFTMAERIAKFDLMSRKLADRFWPGPLTLVLPAQMGGGLHPLVLGGLTTVAVRMPQGPLRQVIEAVGRPIAAPSANRSGRVSPTTAAHVLSTLDDRIDAVVDGGPTSHGLESTIVRATEDRVVLLRPGTITQADLEHASGWPVVRRRESDAIDAPGQMLSHYAPLGRVRLDAKSPEPGEYWIGFGPETVSDLEKAGGRLNLSPTGDLREAAASLFAALSTFDSPFIERIAVAPIPNDGLGEAINDRLRRAAAER